MVSVVRAYLCFGALDLLVAHSSYLEGSPIICYKRVSLNYSRIGATSNKPLTTSKGMVYHIKRTDSVTT